MKTNKLSKNQISHLGCPAYLISQFDSFEEVLAQVHELGKEHVGYRPLLTLDDANQTHYVAHHGGMKYEIADLDLCRKTKAIRLAQQISRFSALTANASFDDARAFGLDIDDQDLEMLTEVNRKPQAFIDKELELYWVPVETAVQTLSALPVGYFTEDMGPVENAGLAKHLQQHYGYELIGVGSDLLCFEKTRELSRTKVAKLVKDIQKLYDCEFDDTSVNDFTQIITEQRWLFIRYSGGFCLAWP